MKPRNFVVAGVGGQGTLVASDIIAKVGMHIGHDVKKSEVHGMAQRGGAVVSHVRWAEKVASPLVEKGKVDFLIVLEQLETLRWLEYLKPGGAVIYNHQQIPPNATVFGGMTYPEPDAVREKIETVAGQVFAVEGTRIANELGHVRMTNVVLLGTLSSLLEEVEESVWAQVMKERLPEKAIDMNLEAFKSGFEEAAKAVAES
jgi:indolepyruvate ferredoxin oxidoreductase beta subunit